MTTTQINIQKITAGNFLRPYVTIMIMTLAPAADVSPRENWLQMRVPPVSMRKLLHIASTGTGDRT